MEANYKGEKKYPHIFQQGRIGSIDVRNRAVMSAMGCSASLGGYVNDAGAVMHTNTKCLGIKADCVIVEKVGKEESVSCDSVVVAVGSASVPMPELEQACKDLDIEYHTIGDAVKPRWALDATADAARAARVI